MSKRDDELKEAFVKRSEAKNNFDKVSNDKESKDRQKWEAYKKYQEANNNLMSIYERIKYAKSA